MIFTHGNDEKYSVSNTPTDENSPLRGKTVIFLGSSVTFGSASKGESFVEYLAKKDGIIPVKEAVSGTTLVDNGDDSYVSRMKRLDKNIQADAFVCQLSTNDASGNLPLGSISGSTGLDDFDVSTVAGSTEYIITYAKNTWNCPVIFYTGTKYDSVSYERMVSMLLDIAEKHGIGVIDLWHDPVSDMTDDEFRLYMRDGVHPTRAGYRERWLPVFEKFLTQYLA